MGEHDEHRQRVYNRFLREGLEGFEEHNAMEFLLFLARPRGDTNALAHRLISHFGSLSLVLDAPVEELEKVPGIGHSSAVILKFIPEMCAYYLNNRLSHKIALDSAEAAKEFFFPKFFGRTEEAFYMAAVDDRRMLLRCVLISEGTANATSVSVQKIVAQTLQCGGTGVVLAHNHPRGLPLPSSSDIAVTRSLYKALAPMNLELLDHFIFSDDGYISMASTNYFASIKKDRPE